MLDAHQNVWDGIPAFVSGKDEFYNKLAFIIQLGQKQKVVNTGITLNKKSVIDTSAVLCTKILNALKSYGAYSKNAILFERARVGIIKIRIGAHSVLLARMTEVANSGQIISLYWKITA